MRRLLVLLLLVGWASASCPVFASPESLNPPSGYPPRRWSIGARTQGIVHYRLFDEEKALRERGYIYGEMFDRSAVVMPGVFSLITGFYLYSSALQHFADATQNVGTAVMAGLSCATALVCAHGRYCREPRAPLFLVSLEDYHPDQLQPRPASREVQSYRGPAPGFPGNLLALPMEVAEVMRLAIYRGSYRFSRWAQLEKLEGIDVVAARTFHNVHSEMVTVPQDIWLSGRWKGAEGTQRRSLRRLLWRSLAFTEAERIAMPPELAGRLVEVR